MRDWRGGGVGELREAKAEHARVSARAEELQRGGSMAGLSSPGLQMDGGGVLGSGSGETAKERGERFARVLVVLLRARNRALGLCLGRATATARWRPRGRFWRRGAAGEAPARGNGWGRRSSATRGRQREAGGGRLVLHGAGGRRSAQRRREQSRELEEGEKDHFAISENSRD